MQIDEIISNYDVTLTRLSEDKIELIRQWRNDPKISQYMEYKEIISPEEQGKWFKKIDNDYNLYYIIEFQNEEIGLINIKNINTNYKTGESGVFVYVDKYLNTDISYRAHLCLFDYCFESLGLEYLSAHILKENKRAIRFTNFIGFKILIEQENIMNQKYVLTKEEYFSNDNRKRFILRCLKALNKNK